METKECEKVSCGSNHPLCFECELTWRSKMPLQDGVRIMTCPTCRQPEKYRTIESLQRTARSKTLTYLAQAADALVVETRRFLRTSETLFIERAAARVHELTSSAVTRAAHPSTREPRSRCASGRCQSTSRTGRAMTYLKCNICHNVFCCRSCRECVGCRA